MYIKIKDENVNEVKGILEKKEIEFETHDWWFRLAVKEAIDEVMDMTLNDPNRDAHGEEYDFPDRIEALNENEFNFYKDVCASYVHGDGQTHCDFINMVSDNMYKALNDLPKLFRLAE